MKIDAQTIAILKKLRDGRRSYRKIAESLGVSENTVRSRVNALIDEGVLEIKGLFDPQAVAGHRVVFVGVKLSTLNLVEKGKEFSRLRGVVSASVVTGRFDLMLVVLLREGFDLLEFYTQEVYKLTDVHSVETFVVYKGYNLKVPYII
jgi:Lrp/AsnC family transcriptional regulator for asnA, asnC and gidA